MKKGLILAISFTVISLNGAEIPNKVVQSIATVEDSKAGASVKEKNGQLSHGKHNICKAFLTDVNKWAGTTYTITDVRDVEGIGERVCGLGLAMIMAKRKCPLLVALATYNGGWKKRNTKTCKYYAQRVMAIANKKEGAK